MQHQVISLGGGVQSSTLCLMAAKGLLSPMPEVAVFADTGHEPQAVMDYLDWLEQQLPFPLIKVQYRDLGEDTLNKAKGLNNSGGSPPLYVRRPGSNRVGMLHRQCTRDYKIRPVMMWVKQHVLGLGLRAHWPKTPQAQLWLGITMDEIQRLKDSSRPAVQHRFPFIYDRPMNRDDCLTWMAGEGYPQPPKSACYFCPYASAGRWAWLKKNDPDSWGKALAFDQELRTNPRDTGTLYLSSEGVPLSQMNLPEPDNADDRSFLAECDGMCGV